MERKGLVGRKCGKGDRRKGRRLVGKEGRGGQVNLKEGKKVTVNVQMTHTYGTYVFFFLCVCMFV